MSAYDFGAPECDLQAGGFDFEDDPGPSVTQLARDVAEGKACRECGVSFVKAHKTPAVCTYCGRRLLETECGVKLAIHAEVQREGWAAINRTKRERRKRHDVDKA